MVQEDQELNYEESQIIQELHGLQKMLDADNFVYDVLSNPLVRQIVRLKFKPACIQVFAYYPQFQKDLITLLKYEYITETENGLKWLKSKQSLAEYFGNQTKKMKMSVGKRLKIYLK
jgi:hypothetical protein